MSRKAVRWSVGAAAASAAVSKLLRPRNSVARRPGYGRFGTSYHSHNSVDCTRLTAPQRSEILPNCSPKAT